jgi:hypothetical protein
MTKFQRFIIAGSVEFLVILAFLCVGVFFSEARGLAIGVILLSLVCYLIILRILGGSEPETKLPADSEDT